VIEENVVVKLKTGLQARPAALFVQEANRFSANVNLNKKGSVVNAKSIMGIMSLAVGHEEELLLSVDGADEVEAFKHLKDFLDQEKI
jgi:catabolite repression HPr-like protein